MEIAIIILSVLLVLALLFIGFLLVFGDLNMYVPQTVEKYSPRVGFTIEINTTTVSDTCVEIRAVYSYTANGKYKIINECRRYVIWMLPTKSQYWKNKYQKHFDKEYQLVKKKIEKSLVKTVRSN